MKSIAAFNRIVRNYLNMTKALNEQNLSHTGNKHNPNQARKAD
jgi:hypothetical protein